MRHRISRRLGALLLAAVLTLGMIGTAGAAAGPDTATNLGGVTLRVGERVTVTVPEYRATDAITWSTDPAIKRTDYSGRAEFWGDTPGHYDMTLTAVENHGTGMTRNYKFHLEIVSDDGNAFKVTLDNTDRLAMKVGDETTLSAKIHNMPSLGAVTYLWSSGEAGALTFEKVTDSCSGTPLGGVWEVSTKATATGVTNQDKGDDVLSIQAVWEHDVFSKTVETVPGRALSVTGSGTAVGDLKVVSLDYQSNEFQEVIEQVNNDSNYYKLKVTCGGTDVTSQTTFTPADPSVVRMSNQFVKGLKVGATTVIATYNGKSATIPVYIFDYTFTHPGVIPVGETRTGKIELDVPAGLTRTSMEWLGGGDIWEFVGAKDQLTCTVKGLKDGSEALGFGYKLKLTAANGTARELHVLYGIKIGSGGSGSNKPDATKVEIEVTGSRTIDTIGGRLQLNGWVEPDDADQTLEWKSSDETVATVDENGLVTAVGPGEVTITASVPGTTLSDSERITVSGVRLKLHTLNLMLGRSETLSYDLFGSANATGQTRWSSSDVNVAAASSGGRVSARAVGPTVITLTYQVGQRTYTDSCNVTVTENTVGLVEGTATAGVPFAISSLRGQLDQVCREATGTLDSDGKLVPGPGLSYLTNLAVAPSEGVLYYNYVSTNDTGAGVGVQERYYLTGGGKDDRGIETLTFVAPRSFSGEATITYTGYNTRGESFNGSIRLTVRGTDDVTYPTTKGTAVTFEASDFNAICTGRTGRTLSYVTFTLPSASQGALYYGYTGPGQYTSTVNASNQYYRNRTPFLDQITFVPSEKATGTVKIGYRAVDTAGTAYSGTVSVIISGGGTADEDDALSYTAAPGVRVAFSVFDINDACQRALGGGDSLYYIRIKSLPAASRGTLSYDNRGTPSYTTRVNETTRYYLAGTPSIARLNFTPASKSVESVSIPFTGYSYGGKQFDGTLTIHYSEGGRGSSIVYNVGAGKTALFEAADFNEKSTEESGTALNYLRFDTLPSSGEGTLYYNYNTNTHAGTQVASNTVLYRSYLSQVAFVPRSGFTGTVSLNFTGTNIAGDTFTGTVEINVEAVAVEPIRYSGTSLPVSLRASDFESRCRDVLDGELSYIQFTQVDSDAGRLYYNYRGYGTGSQVPLSTQYYSGGSPNISNLTFLPKAEFIGSTTLRYNAVSSSGSIASGTVVISVSGGTSRFQDMSGYRWAASSVDFLYDCGVVEGMNDAHTMFGPGRNISRRDFVVMLCRAFNFSTSSGESFPDVPAGRYYSDAIATAKALGIVEGSGGLFMPTATLSRQDAMVMLQRAMNAAGRYVPSGSGANLSAYSDRGQISSYARNAVGAMVQMGIVTGNAGQLSPRNSISRAEMALILHRVMTL